MKKILTFLVACAFLLLTVQSAFAIETTVSRGDFAKMVLQNAGFSQTNYKPLTQKRFFDVSVKNNPNSPYIYRLADLGLFKFEKGKKNVFKPNDPIKKYEALEWIFFIGGMPVPKVFDDNQFAATDVNPKSEIAPVFNKAINLGMFDVSTAKPGKVYPNSKLKQNQAEKFLKIAHENKGPTLTVTIVPSVESDIMKTPAFDTFVTVWNKIKNSYLKRDATDKTKLIYGATEGIVKELGDKHSDFERPGDNAVIESLSGEIEGIGAVIQMENDEPIIVAPIAGAPADLAGLMANDVIIEVDDLKVKGMKLIDIVAKIKGKKGTQVKLKIRRDGKFVMFNITRDVVKISSATLKRTEDNIGIIPLANFGSNLESEFQKIIEDLEKTPVNGIIIDVRNNPGGYLTAAVSVSGHFIKNGEKIAIVKYPDHEEPQYSVGKSELAKYKTIILVNKGSASASEILAGALQDFGLAKVVGETTYGKGTVQELSDFIDGSSLKLTVAEWLTPKGRSIEDKGITPDIEVKMTGEDKAAGKDPQMDRALQELRNSNP